MSITAILCRPLHWMISLKNKFIQEKHFKKKVRKMNNFIPVTDIASPELDIYARLSENQLFHINEPGPGLFIAESPKVIGRALAAGCGAVSFLIEERQLTAEAEEVLAECPDVPVYTASEEVFRQLTGFVLTRGMLAAMRRPERPSWEALAADKRRIAILEHVVNPTNVGAIFRAAAALNVDAVLITTDSADPYYRRAARVSMGTVFQVPWTYLPENEWPEKALMKLRALGFASAALALKDDSVSIDDPALKKEEKLALILGTEGDGLNAVTIEGCDYTVKIPMRGGVDSLNVAAAAAVAFWEMR